MCHIVELLASKYALELLAYVRDHPLSSKTDILRAFPYDEKKTRYRRLRELHDARLVEVVDMDGRKGHRVHALRLTDLGTHVLDVCMSMEGRFRDFHVVEVEIRAHESEEIGTQNPS